MKIQYNPVGTIYTPFTGAADMPIQPAGAAGVKGRIEIFPEYADGLKSLSGFSHIMLLYHFHKAGVSRLAVVPFMDSKPHGVFATRAPARPNPIGVSVVRLLKVEGIVLSIENVDILDRTPLLDIKPFVPEFDHHPVERIGWLKKRTGKVRTQKSDDRFARRKNGIT